MSSRAPSRPEAYDLVVVALSARALAASARRAGLRTMAIDLFADEDTLEHATHAVRAEPSRRGPGFPRRSLLETLEREAPVGTPVVLGAGFEHAPSLMRAIGKRNPIRGAAPDVVQRLKDPLGFAALLRDLQIAHPAIRMRENGAATHLSPVGRGRPAGPGEGDQSSPESPDPPNPLSFASRPLPTVGRWAAALPENGSSEGAGWLSKRVGASGGAHIHQTQGPATHRRYVQQRVTGRAVSALFLADGRSIRIVGFSDQWADPTPSSPFRYGGAVGPVALDGLLAEKIEAALACIVAATGLVGLASADLIVTLEDGPPFWLLEINPRPGATLDVFDAAPLPPLLALHLDACAGRLARTLPSPDRARAAAIVYAPRRFSPKTLRRPLWTADWPSCDGTVPAGAPVCTVLADAASPSEARALASFRRETLLKSIRAAATAPTNAMVPA